MSERKYPVEPRAPDVLAIDVGGSHVKMVRNGIDERRHWENQLDLKISQYLHSHPEAASSQDVMTFRFMKQASVGQTNEQVLILLGPPLARTTDEAEMEKLARRYWPYIKGNATEAWVYPDGWNLYFRDSTLVDITQYLVP